MEAGAQGLAHVSAERIGGGIRADGMGELSKLLLGSEPRRALLLARDTGVLSRVMPEFVPTIGYSLLSERQPLPLDEHLFAVAQNAADAGDRLVVRLACLLHDLGKPFTDGTGESHAEEGARITDRILRRLRYPTRVRVHIVRIVAGHAFPLNGTIDARHARRFLAAHGEELAFDLIAHKRADLGAKRVPTEEHDALALLRDLVDAQRSQPYRMQDLAIDGDDLRSIGFGEGPELGAALRVLLAAVVDEPQHNERSWLLDRAAKELS